ncbi:GTP-binding protein [Aurantimonas manganoxydans SI85-9A1]|jgi:GTPase|uniref:GTPase Der n=1 Tax=Aurantimonas manganoxydans (strain ATCC BAA-1229 / DSM 21871 / SI85-9A1) TaxID=287752 RepID=Q1YKP6_AURMS|nr:MULTISPECIES: ribosome biogenesis GTPase Der [Aurantimonas]EAS50477.1 GTP-binding protein [Aurantimonas manganoxydans SI85-9A1]MCC4296077.1 ribosome biogenesis GTPase Der [Aurantimonas coralicida]MCD1642688.1 ribosome biogenesis GTPase Der [Aurantimonas coralicida]MCW7543306.1 ribosome biogenesis GTPase Der [Aurantimonas litoralis]
MVTIAIIGRPNVGKSTLFNRLVGKRLALVDDRPGVTRDRRTGDATLLDLDFEVVDTAGLEEAGADTLEGRMRTQTETAIASADLCLFMIDVKAGVMPQDRAFVEIMRRTAGKVILVANKSEARGAEAGMLDAFELGLGEPIGISAEHGVGMGELRDAILEALGEETFADDTPEPEEALVDVPVEDDEVEPVYDATKPLRIAIVGRPNAGKSTLINRFLGEDRMLTGPEAGITRDSIASEWEWRGRTIKVFDTAGMRRKAKVQEKLEKLSVADGLRAIKFAEVVVVVFDATIPFERQDMSIVDLVMREGRAPVIAFNKWDLIEDRQEVLADLREKTDRLLPQARGIRAITVSGETGEGVERLMKAIVDTHEVWNKRISTAKLNQWLDRMVTRHSPPAVAGRRINIKYMTQVKSRPPTFMISTSRPDALNASYTRYLINGLRESFGLFAVPIRLGLRKPDNPYAGKRKRPS